MASIKTLKKDINLLLSLVLNDCFYIVETNEKADKEKIMAIASEVLSKHKELRKRVNHPDGKNNPKLVKKYYNSIVTELLQTVDKSLESLAEAAK